MSPQTEHRVSVGTALRINGLFTPEPQSNEYTGIFPRDSPFLTPVAASFDSSAGANMDVYIAFRVDTRMLMGDGAVILINVKKRVESTGYSGLSARRQ
jgi:hypothetical protein